MPSSFDFATSAYAALAHAVRLVDDDASWAPTGCRGWSVRDLTHHCWADTQRALVALHSPTDEPPDVDDVTYWADWGVDESGAANGRRYVRVVASMFDDWSQLRGEYLDTMAALVHALAGSRPADAVRTQGHTITVDGLASTLAVEATIHHLDLVAHLSAVPGPGDTLLAGTRAVLDRLASSTAGQSFPSDWPHERCIALATGRAQPTADEARALPFDSGMLPFFS